MKRRCLLSVLLLSLVFLWGCGLELNSRMELNKDFSGHRIMTCTVSSADLSRYFSGSKKDLDKVIRDACPKALVYKQTLITTIPFIPSAWTIPQKKITKRR